jgi:signal transduction histidine kinase
MPTLVAMSRGPRVGPSRDDDQRVESTLARARLFLVASLLAVSSVTVLQNDMLGVQSLLWPYVCVCVIALFFLGQSRRLTPGAQVLVHAIDVGLAAFAASVTPGSDLPLIIAVVFVSYSAACRWGLSQAIVSVLIALGLNTLAAVLFSSSIHPTFEPSWFLTRAAYALIAGGLTGYLADEQRRLRLETAAVARVTARINADLGLKATLRFAADELSHLFRASSISLVVQEVRTGRVFHWETRNVGHETTFQCSELEPNSANVYLFPSPVRAWVAVRRRRLRVAALPAVLGLDPEGGLLPDTRVSVPGELMSVPFRALFRVHLEFGDEWKGSILLFSTRTAGPNELRAFDAFVCRLAPAVYSGHLVRGFRFRAGMLERARVAREIHDGMIQSVLAVELRIAALRRTAAGSATVARELLEIQELLHEEVLRLRDVTLALTPLEFAPSRLIDVLSESIATFQQDTGIAASFIAEPVDFNPPPRTCHELVRIVQEALINVRRHSGAERVSVQLGRHHGHYRIVIDDDGRGFDFDGRLGQSELDLAHRGPAVMRDRLRALGGALTIDSRPGRGARLEIVLPSGTYEHATGTYPR